MELKNVKLTAISKGLHHCNNKGEMAEGENKEGERARGKSTYKNVS